MESVDSLGEIPACYDGRSELNEGPHDQNADFDGIRQPCSVNA